MSLRRPEPILFALLGTIWGSAYLAIKVGAGTLEPFTLVATRLLIGAALLAAVAVIRREALPVRRDWPHVAVVGVTGLVVPFLLITWGQRDVDAGLASIFNAAMPLFTLGLAALLLADEPLRAGRTLGIVVGFVGIVLVAGSGIERGGSPASIVALVVATFSYALTAVYTRRFLRGSRPLGLALGQSIVGLAVTAPLALVLEAGSLAVPPPAALGAVLWLGLLASGVAPLLFFRLIGAWGANRTALVNYLIPIVGVAAGALVLGEELQPRTLVGGAVVLAGLALASRSPELGRLGLGPVLSRLRPRPAATGARA